MMSTLGHTHTHTHLRSLMVAFLVSVGLCALAIWSSLLHGLVNALKSMAVGMQ